MEKTQLMNKSQKKEPEKKNKSNNPWIIAWRRLLRDKTAVFGLYIIIFLIFIAVFAPILSPYHPIEDFNLSEAFQGPSMKHWFGTDWMGRDILSRVLYGSRISLTVGLASRVVTLSIGITLGALAGYFRGKVDMVIMRLAEIMDAFPNFLFAIAISVAIGPGLYTVFFALGFVGWSGMARLIRGQVMLYRESEFVEAARSLGASNSRIIFKEILPNCMAPVIISTTMGISSAIMAEASLSFLGLGAQPPTPTWGSMMNFGRQYIWTAPYMIIFPGLAIVLTVYGFNLFGDGLRDVLDPRMKD
ncbi:ABC transporter permease [Paramaledivibacter caminithermalis]|jgi:peptide/nickel transport system permease protein/oligopeptide transport system permease protein|uniref:Oligopeptide transport system permease protein n=1 Tax=Paramaledivibacter caminithermalis (strain DSM 15212 / CIP 107654 / DViRD3) TaxID=1121301 RepID=A0A1M6PVD1_PARC5|nr:ABC transporter permease [Paramaledivibacter caminithermalis]SHK11868.1 oligopeptide transport system permease protein [Paramaledivibacter caminithermalis DSM 15212]